MTIYIPTTIYAHRTGRILRAVSSRLFKWTPDAITVGYSVIYWAPPSPDVVRHEMEHIMQTIKIGGRLRFWWAYLGELRREGYRNNRFERSARVAAGQELP